MRQQYLDALVALETCEDASQEAGAWDPSANGAVSVASTASSASITSTASTASTARTASTAIDVAADQSNAGAGCVVHVAQQR